MALIFTPKQHNACERSGSAVREGLGPDGFAALSFIRHRAARLRPDPVQARHLLDQCVSAGERQGGLRPTQSMSLAELCAMMDDLNRDPSL